MLTDWLPTGGPTPGWTLGLVALLAKVTVILLVALALTRSMRRAPAGSRHLVWLVTLGALLLAPALAVWAPIPLRVLPSTLAPTRPPIADVGLAAPSSQPPQGSALPIDRRRASAPSPNDDASAPAPVHTSAGEELARLAAKWGFWAGVAAWVTVALLILGTLARSSVTVRRIVGRSLLLDGAGWETPLVEVADRVGLDEVPRLLVSPECTMPFACGLITPTIVLPNDCHAWSPDRRRAVLLHELAHVRRGDLLGHLLGRLVCAVYWFHPLAWLAAKRLRAESERACDDLAVTCGTRAADYAEHLLDIVTAVRATATPAVALAMARRQEFEGRLLAILDPDLRHAAPSRRQSAALIGALALSAVLVAAAAPMPVGASRSEPTMPHDATRDDAARAAAAPPPPPSVAVAVAQDASRDVTVSSEAPSDAPGRASSEPSSDAERAVQPTSPDERPVLLARVLKSDSSARLRRIAAWGLHEHPDSPAAIDALAAALRVDASADVREMAAWALGDHEPGHDVAEALGAALRNDPNPRVRATAAWALGRAGGADAGGAITAGLSDSSADVRLRSAWALGHSRISRAPPALLAMLRDHDAEVRQLAAWALFRIQDPAALPALQSALKAESDDDCQLADLRAIAALGERSVDAIRDLLDSSNPAVKAMAVRALAGGDATGPWPWPWPDPRPFP